MNKDEIFLKEAEALHSLRALEEIERNPEISQRELSNRLGVALGITNALLKTLVRKGLIKIRGKNNRSLTYHLTHAGVMAKSKLAMKWTLNTIDYYRQARINVANRLAALVEQGISSVVLYGLGDLTEMVAILAPEVGLDIVGIIDHQMSCYMKSTLDYPVIKPEELMDKQLDAVIICIEVDGSLIKELGRHVKASTKLYQVI